MDLRQQLISMEGWVHRAYPDPLTGNEPWTIGAGHCGPEVVKGLEWTDEQIGEALDADIERATRGARAICSSFDKLDECRRAVLVNMVFQMGRDGVSNFRGMLQAINDQRWYDAANCMRDSRWARAQTPKRAARLARQMETGEWN
jgi:lysozyme